MKPKLLNPRFDEFGVMTSGTEREAWSEVWTAKS